MKHRNIPYTEARGSFTCKYFNFYPYHIISFSTDTEEDMHKRINEYVENKSVYEAKYKLSKQASGDFYRTLSYKGD